jgi:hypothetical protein
MKLFCLKNHNGRILFETTEVTELAAEILKYEGATGNRTSVEVVEVEETKPNLLHLV